MEELLPSDVTESEFKRGLREIDADIDKANEAIALGKSLQKMMDSKEWIEVIDGKLLGEEAERLPTAILNVENHLNRDSIDNMVDGLKGIRFFKTFIGYMHDDGIIAESALEQLKNTRQEWLEMNSDSVTTLEAE